MEIDSRDLKVTRDTENIRGKRLDTDLMELLGLVIAYNLVGQFRRQAVKQGQETPRGLSFKGVWLSFTYHLLHAPPLSFEEWQKKYTTALECASKHRLPRRPQPRSDPRMSHPRRQKTTKAQNALRKNKPQISGV